MLVGVLPCLPQNYSMCVKTYLSALPFCMSWLATNFNQLTRDILLITEYEHLKVCKAEVMLQLAYETKCIPNQNVTKAAAGFAHGNSRHSIKYKFLAAIWSIAMRRLTVWALYQPKVAHTLAIVLVVVCLFLHHSHSSSRIVVIV